MGFGFDKSDNGKNLLFYKQVVVLKQIMISTFVAKSVAKGWQVCKHSNCGAKHGFTFTVA